MATAVAVLLCALAATPWVLTRIPTHPCGHVPLRRAKVQVHLDPAVVLDLAGAALRSGAPVPSVLAALGRAVPNGDGEALARVVAALRLGATWQEAWPPNCPTALMPLRDALGPAWTDGVDPGPILVQAAATIRARRGRRAREAAARLGVRLVLPLGLCLLPAFVLLGLVPVLLSTGLGVLGP